MSRRITTIFDHAFPKTPEWDAIADAWAESVVEEMLTLVWGGFDQMKRKILAKVNFNQPLHQLERTLTDAHVTEITLLWKANRTGFESFLPKHEAWEPSSIASPSAMPPSYDIGFENVNDPRLRWPVEAKVLTRPTDVLRYLGDLRQKYLTGVGAPFSTEGALLGYLIAGQPADTLSAIELSLGTLKSFPLFASRHHQTSEHSGSVPGINSGAREKMGTQMCKAHDLINGAGAEKLASIDKRWTGAALIQQGHRRKDQRDSALLFTQCDRFGEKKRANVFIGDRPAVLICPVNGRRIFH